ncbi:MAG: flagellar biosynthesis protein FlaG [Spirochaetales bacterium]|nr:flagellar biosynthesis protein FlaG [Spirochaetales bacterium]
MELDITGIGKSAPAHEIVNRRQANNQQAPKEARKVAQNLAKLAVESKKKGESVENYLSELLNITQFFNKRLRFTINKELDQVVVKVIDSQTDRVVKEIPPEVLQQLHVRIREAIGLLIDEVI